MDNRVDTPVEERPVFVRWLDAPLGWDELGGKAGPLARLLAAGLPVPPGFVVLPTAFQEQPPRDGSTASVPLRPEAVRELQGAYRELGLRLGGADPLVAVRSSATAEDLPGASFAGQYETYLHVRGDAEVLTYIARCRESLDSEHAQAYRRHREPHGGTGLPLAMAVLVQALVEAEAAGVAFTAHPTSGDRSRVLVNAAWGLGSSIVNGEVEADTYLVDRQTLAVVEQHIGQKTSRTGAGPTAPRQDVPEALQGVTCLTTEHATAVARLALQAEAVIGSPADVEWAQRGNAVWLLQARPITALPATFPMAGALEAAPASDIAGPTAAFPFTWPDEQTSRTHWQLGSFDQRRVEALRPLEQDIRVIWSRTGEAASVICGRPRTRVFWHVNSYEYFGLVANPQSEADQALCRVALEQVVAALTEQGETYRQAIQFPWIDAGNARLAAVDVDALPHADLAAHFCEALRWYERLWTAHWTSVQDGPGQRYLQVYKQYFSGHGTDGANAAPTGALTEQALEAAARGLLIYEPNALTAAIDGLIELARTVQQHAALRELFQSSMPAAALEALPRTPGGDQFQAQLDRLLERQGLRSGAGFGTDWNHVLPGWSEQPALVLELVQRYVPQDLDELPKARQAALAAREQRVAELLAQLPDEPARATFTFWLTAARRQQQTFEGHNYKIDCAAGTLLHRAIAACARRLVAFGVLSEPDAVWWLRTHEITLALNALVGVGPTDGDTVVRATVAPAGTHWPALLAARQAHHAWCQSLTPPSALGTLSADPAPPLGIAPWVTPPPPGAAAMPGAETETPPALLMKGEPGSNGVATGRVRLVSQDDLVPDLAAGDVLVAPNAGPIWTPLFPVVAAVVLDHGVLFQHAMLTCREYGVPAVFQTKDATQRLREGQRVAVDGTHGWVLAAEEIE